MDTPLLSNPLTITQLHFLENCGALHLFCVNTLIAITFPPPLSTAGF